MTALVCIKHRVNRASELAEVAPAQGVEIDVRSDVAQGGRLHLSHDPWALGEDLAVWLQAYSAAALCGPLIINTKEDGLEHAIVAHLRRAQVRDYFFLDTAPPTLRRLLDEGWGEHLSVRISAHEPLAAAAPWFEHAAGHATKPPPRWLWVDCFDGVPLPTQVLEAVSKRLPLARLCLVSPELQGQPLSHIAQFRPLTALAHAVCTKAPKAWLHHLGSGAAAHGG